MCSSAVSSAIRDTGSPMIVTRRPRCRTRAPSASARAASLAVSGVRMCTYRNGRSGGGAGTFSPSSVRARKRLAAPRFLMPCADAAHSMPFGSMATVKMRAPTASGTLTIAYASSAQARLVNGARRIRRSGALTGLVIRIAAWSPRPSGRGGNAASPPRKCQCCPIVCSHVPVPAAPQPRPAGGAAGPLRPRPVHLEPGRRAALPLAPGPGGRAGLPGAVPAAHPGTGREPVAGCRLPDGAAAGAARLRPGDDGVLRPGEPGQTVGIDRGVAVSAALSTGELLHCPGLTARERTRLRRMQRTLARAKRGSNRRGRVRHAIARLRARETDRRKDWAEKASTDLARRFEVIRVEDLQITNTTRSAKGTRENPGRNVRAKPGVNRGILASGWGLRAWVKVGGRGFCCMSRFDVFPGLQAEEAESSQAGTVPAAVAAGCGGGGQAGAVL